MRLISSRRIEYMNGKIYKIYNTINDKLYIGKTVSTLEDRFNQHIRDSKKDRNEKRPLYNAMNKYGIECFFIELIEECPLEELSKKESYWIGYYNTYENGYNATLGGDGTILYDYELIVELFNQGFTCKQISDCIGCDIKVVRNALISAGLDPMKNMVTQFSKKVGMYDIKTGELLKVFSSQSEGARWLQDNGKTTEKRIGSISARIGQVCSGKRKTAYKYIWKRL